MTEFKDHYRVLGLEFGASNEEIRKAYRRLAGKYHTDNKVTGNLERFVEVQEAEGILTDLKKRKDYDSAYQSHKNVGLSDWIDLLQEVGRTSDRIFNNYKKILDDMKR